MSDQQLPPTVPPFLALVFYRHDGTHDYDRNMFDDLGSAIEWAVQIFTICDATAESALVYEFFINQDNEIDKVLRFEKRKGGAS